PIYLYLPFFFLGSPPPKAFGELRPIAIGPDSFCFTSPPATAGGKFLTLPLVRTHPPSLISPPTGARARSLAHPTNGGAASPETRAALAIAVAKLRAEAGQPVFPIP